MIEENLKEESLPEDFSQRIAEMLHAAELGQQDRVLDLLHSEANPPGLIEALRKTEHFQTFTHDARLVLLAAQEEAAQMQSSSIEPEHLFLGLLREQNEVTGFIFKDTQLSWEKAKSQISTETLKVAACHEPQNSTDTNHILELAAQEAKRSQTSGSMDIHPEHLLVGLLLKGDFAQDVLHNSNLKLELARSLIRDFRKSCKTVLLKSPND